MARLPYLDPADAEPPVAALLGRLPSLNILTMLANAQGAFGPFMSYVAAVVDEREIDALSRELVILRVASLSPGADYEWHQHVAIARDVGVSDEQISAIGAGDAEAACFDDRQQLVLRFTTEVVRNVACGANTLTAMSATFSAREIVHLVHVIGLYMAIARVMAVSQIDLDSTPGRAAFDEMRREAAQDLSG